MQFVAHKDMLLRSVMGHSILFKKDEPVHVPKMVWAEAQAAGAVPVETLPEEVKAETREPLDPADREKAIMAAFEKVTLTGSREDFAGTGLPHGAALERVMGFKIDNKERDKLWKKFTRMQAGGDE